VVYKIDRSWDKDNLKVGITRIQTRQAEIKGQIVEFRLARSTLQIMLMAI